MLRPLVVVPAERVKNPKKNQLLAVAHVGQGKKRKKNRRLVVVPVVPVACNDIR